MDNRSLYPKRKLTIIFLSALLLLAILSLSSCSQASSMSRPQEVFGVDTAPEAEFARDEAMSANLTTTNQAIERLIIKNANLSLVVDNPEKAQSLIAKMAEELGGFVVTARVYQNTLENGQDVTQADVTVRVPAEKLDEALEKIRGLSNKPPLSQSLDSQDVTREYTDLRSQLRNSEAAEAQLTKLMEQARTTDEVLKVYEQLIQVRQQIEMLKGQIQYYEQSAALSAIQVQLLTDEAVKPLTIGSWQPGGVAKKAVQALINTLKFVFDFVIYLIIYILPVLLVLFLLFGLPIWLIVRAVRRRSRSKQPSIPDTSTPTEQKQ